MKRSVFFIFALSMAASCIFAQTFKAEMWSTYDDKGNGGSSIITLNAANETVEGTEALVATATGSVTTKYQYGFVGMIATPDKEILSGLVEGKGIRFKTSGDGLKYRVRVETSDITDFDYYGKEFTAPKGTPKEVVLKYSDLVQEPWGAQKKFDRSKIVKVSFQTVGQPIKAFSVKIIDLMVLK
jgi:hypothetical protein